MIKAPGSRTGCCGCGSSSGCATAPVAAPAGRAVRREPRGAHQPGRLPALGNPGPAGAGYRPGAVDRHALRQQVDAPGHPRRPPRRRPRTASPSSTTSPSSTALRRGARRPPAVRPAQPRQRRRHQVRPGPAARPPRTGSGPDRPRPEAGRRREPARHPAGHALAAGDDVLPEPDRHEERADAGRVPGVGPRLPAGPTRFLSEVYGLPATRQQLARIEEALQLRETVREHLFAGAAG